MADIKLHEIKNVEIFASGNWNGDKYTTDDIDRMIAAAAEIPTEIPIKKGHSREIGERAYGWVRNLRRKGIKLLADFVDVPDDVYSWIKARLFNHVSIEVIYNHQIRDRVYPRVLAAVSLLGSERPAVSILAPLRANVLKAGASIHCYSLPFRQEATMHNEYTFSNERIDNRIVKLAQQHVDAGRVANLEQGFLRTLSEHPDLAIEYRDFVSIR